MFVTEKDMCLRHLIKKSFIQRYIWKNNLRKQISVFLFPIIISCNVFAVEDEPYFVVNAIVHVPSSFKPLKDIGEYKDELVSIPYSIEKDINTRNPRRGKLWGRATIPQPNENAYRISSILGPFFDRLIEEGFGEDIQESHGMISSRVGVAAFLNRMRSVSESTNQEFFNCVDDLAVTIEHRFIMSLWEPQWIRKDITITGQTRYKPVNLTEVTAYYEKLKISNPALAHAFLQVNEYQHLNSIVPYRELRETLLKDEATKGLVRHFRGKTSKSPVYIAFMDADVLSFRTGKKGVFSCYEEAITNNSATLHGLTTGYSVSVNQDPFASLAVSFDLGIRQALSTLFPLAPYYPEPNAIIRVLKGCDTLEVSFPGISTTSHAKYTSPQEVPLLIKEIVRTRFNNSNAQASSHFKFLTEGAIETKLPPRFLQNRKNKGSTKNTKIFTGQFAHEMNQFITLTHQDLTYVRNTSQSHLKTRDWSGYVYHYLEEHMRPESITVVNVNQPGAIIKNRKDQFLISMFSSIHSAYSPISIALRDVKVHGYNLIEYLFSFVRDYASMTPAPLRITYGNSKGNKTTGDLLRKNVLTYDSLHKVIDKFYTRPIAMLAEQAARVCGMSELPIIVRYIQSTHTVAISKPLGVHKIE
jgi:hypothetical protein